MCSSTLSLTSALDWWWVVNATPWPFYSRERPGTLCIGRWVVPMAGLDGCGNLAPTGIRSPDRPSPSQSLYRLSYPGPRYIYGCLPVLSIGCWCKNSKIYVQHFGKLNLFPSASINVRQCLAIWSPYIESGSGIQNCLTETNRWWLLTFAIEEGKIVSLFCILGTLDSGQNPNQWQ